MGGKLVNVETAEIESKVDIAIKSNRIALVGDAKHCVGAETRVIDARGKYILPGLLDAHVHIESSMLTVTQFARAVLPHGTTGVFIDPHEIANVLGMCGVKLMLDEGDRLPLKVFVMLPSCVPSAPGLETSGAEINQNDIVKGLKWRRVVGLGEVMNYPGVLAGNKKMRDEIDAALNAQKVVEGHAPGLLGKELAAYIAAGVRSDHESLTPGEAVQKLRLGMALEIREGSAAKNLAALVKPIIKFKLDTRHCLLATDDCHPEDLMKEGHIDHVVRRAIKEGVDPIKAIQMATLNTAEHFELDREIGSISPGKIADVVMVGNLEKFNVERVIANGKIVAERGKLKVALPIRKSPSFARKTMKLKREVNAEDFEIIAKKAGKVKARVIGIVDRQIVTSQHIERLETRDGAVLPDAKRDIAKVAVVERHRATGNIGLGFVRGFGIRRGAIASSVGHDAHNITVIGVSDEDMATAVNTIASIGGGQVVVNRGKILARVGLPIAGLMSDEP
ncbi:MAG: adenine deaminase, partial [Candidatus Hadarchaeum sp.]|nr:adenine deaminase [Candidatus Hadarchaeum sp.]